MRLFVPYDHLLGKEQNRTDYLFDVNYTVFSQSNTIMIYISRSQILLKILKSSCSAYLTILA